MEEKKPDFRHHDESPKRNDDVSIAIPWFKYEGSGRLLAILLVATGLLAVSVVSIGYMWFHDSRTAADHSGLVRTIEAQTRTIEVQICVLTLNEMERREYQTEGKYCPSPRVRYRDERIERDERRRYVKG